MRLTAPTGVLSWRIVDRVGCGEQPGPGRVQVARAVPPAVRLAPLLPLLPRLLLVAVPWAVVFTGRGVCLLAQHVPALVWLVRAVRRWKHARAARPGGCVAAAAGRSAAPELKASAGHEAGRPAL